MGCLDVRFSFFAFRCVLRSLPVPKPAPKSRKRSSRPAPEVQPEVQTVSFVSLGCPKNLVDSEKMLGLLAQDGLLPVSYDPADPEGSEAADAVVINTCGFLEASKEESLQVIKDAIRQKEEGKIQRV